MFSEQFTKVIKLPFGPIYGVSINLQSLFGFFQCLVTWSSHGIRSYVLELF